MLRAFSLYVISCIRQPVAQELDKIHVLYARKFCRPTSGVVLKQSRYSASVERVLVYISRCVNKKNAITMPATMASCSIAILTAQGIRQILQYSKTFWQRFWRRPSTNHGTQQSVLTQKLRQNVSYLQLSGLNNLLYVVIIIFAQRTGSILAVQNGAFCPRPLSWLRVWQ